MRLRPGEAPKRRLTHIWNSSACIACGSCVTACNATNYPEMLYREDKSHHDIASNIRKIETVSAEGRPQILLNQCAHCDDAPCVNTCPFGAVYRDDDGLVRIDPRMCAGCKYCVTSCPYNVRWVHPDSGLPMKCMGDGCLSLVAAGLQPACVQACPCMARDFGDLNDPESSVSVTLRTKKSRRLLPNSGAEPKFFIVEEV
ncbi:MAG: 4Fe-4S dicluster domain-containing protein [Rubrimonas sp.]